MKKKKEVATKSKAKGTKVKVEKPEKVVKEKKQAGAKKEKPVKEKKSKDVVEKIASEEEKKSSKESRLKINAQELGIKKLIKKGKKQGYLTLDDLLELFPHAEEDIETLDFLYDKLLDSGIDVFDIDSEKEAEKVAKLEEIDLSKIKLDKTTTSDPVRMYLKEIGTYSL